MTTSRAVGLSCLLLACSSSALQNPDVGVPGDGPGGDATALSVAADASADTSAPDLAPDVRVDSAADVLPDLGPAMCTAPPDTYGPLPSCTPDGTQGCDPVCQTRCGCGERCVVGPSGPACRDQAGPFAGLGQSCTPNADTCRPGLTCLQESADHAACGAHCYRNCRTDADCSGGAKCSITFQFGASAVPQHVCSPPPETCEPFGAARCANAAQRPYPTFGCYVMSQNQTNLAVCDCAGTLPVGAACTFERQCAPGAECILEGTIRQCRKICSVELVVGPNPAPCPAGQTCKAFTGSVKYGYCQ